MTPDFSNLVYPVITTALDIRDRVERGDPLDLEKERGRLIELLPANVASGLQAGYSGDGRIFLGARYALACWIDELFIVHSSWAERWKPVTLELALFGTRERATRFWEQADIVLGRPGAPKPPDRPGDDALETFFLCIVLGFRGTYAEDAAKVREYVEEMRREVARAADWDQPAELGVKTNIEPLLGREALRRVVAVYGGLALLVVLVLLILARVLA